MSFSHGTRIGSESSVPGVLSLPGSRGRLIVGDTETTGLWPTGARQDGQPSGDPEGADRMVEVAFIELMDLMPTGRRLHLYMNPERSMPTQAFRVHGLSDEYLAAMPTFSEVGRQIRDFVGDDYFVAHNAKFDQGFLSAEFGRVGIEDLKETQIIDTLSYARKRFPMQKNTLDALCNRFGVDLSRRTLHGALLDTELLAEVLLHLHGGRQMGLLNQIASSAGFGASPVKKLDVDPRYFEPLNPRRWGPAYEEPGNYPENNI
jgi:DNA polymerase-3 subunit epsilon